MEKNGNNDNRPGTKRKNTSSNSGHREKISKNAGKASKNFRTLGNDDRCSSSDETASDNESLDQDSPVSNTEVEASNDNIEELTIHKIDLQKFGKSKSLGKKAIEKVIDKIVAAYKQVGPVGNNLNEARGEDGAPPVYVEYKGVKLPKLCKQDRFPGEQYSGRFYGHDLPAQSGFAKSQGFRRKKSHGDEIGFYYRKNELFTLSKGNAWKVVHEYADREFPQKVAARILSPKGQIEVSSKSLVGNEGRNQRKMKSAQAYNPRQLLEICTNFKAESRKFASILKFSCFQKCNPSESGAVRLRINLCSLRILKHLKLSDYFCIFNHFSIISRGEDTFQYPNTTVKEEDTDAHRRYLVPVTREKSKCLDIRLANEIRKAIQSEKKVTILGQYDLCHNTDVTGFTLAKEYNLLYNTKRLHTFTQYPSVGDVFNIIQSAQKVQKKLLNERNQATIAKPDAFLVALNKVKMSFVNHNTGGKKTQKLIDFMEGSLADSRGKVHWRIKSTWCTPKDEFILILHQQWLNMLRKCLIGDNDSDRMPLDYSNQEEFFSHETTEKNLLFDVVKVKEDKKIVMYFTVNSFRGGDLSKIGTQILNIVDHIQKGSKQNNQNDKSAEISQLEEFYDESPSFQTYFPSFSEFIESLSTAKIMLVISVTNSEDRDFLNSLENEKNLKTKIEKNELIRQLTLQGKTRTFGKALGIPTNSAREINNILSDRILKTLAKGGYMDQMRNITTQLLCCSRNSFQINFNDEFKGITDENTKLDLEDFIFQNGIKNFQSSFVALKPKWELLSISKTLMQNDGKHFKICQIVPSEESN